MKKRFIVLDRFSRGMCDVAGFNGVFLICLIVLFGFYAECNSSSCDQATYDLLYKQIVTKAVQEKNIEKALKERNEAIKILRKLCNGQVSSYEKGL